MPWCRVRCTGLSSVGRHSWTAPSCGPDVRPASLYGAAAPLGDRWRERAWVRTVLSGEPGEDGVRAHRGRRQEFLACPDRLLREVAYDQGVVVV